MKIFLPLLMLVVGSLRAELLFSGFMTGPRGLLFSLTETASNESSGWLGIGQCFGDCEIANFDREREILTIKRDGKFRALHLRDSKPTESTDPLADAATPAAVIPVPPLETIKGLIGLDEAIAAQGREAAERRIRNSLNRHINRQNRSPEDRTQLLADYVSGKRRSILIPPSGIDPAFAKKYGLTAHEVENSNRGNDVGRESAKNQPGNSGETGSR